MDDVLVDEGAITELERTATAEEVSEMLAMLAAVAQGDILIFPEPCARQIKMLGRSPCTRRRLRTWCCAA